MAGNILYYGDNLEVMRQHLADESVDLVYLDPPFNSARDYNVLFKQAKKDENQAQITAFTDTWQWSKRRYDEFFEEPRHAPLFDLMESLHRILGSSEMMAYLLMMAPRLLDLRRVLKPTGSLYLHCDPVASHYLKLMLDKVFGSANFRNEIIWHYGGRGAKAVAGQFGRNHDVVLFYSKQSKSHRFCRQYTKRELTRDEARKRGMRQDDNGRWFKTAPRGDYTDESVGQLEAQGRIHRTSSGSIRVKYFLDAQGELVIEPTLVGDVWLDVPDAMHIGSERMGYPTQKPLALLERIITASSNPGDAVLDPFCGCGTAVVAAERLGRRWIGIDITYVAMDLIISRLARDFGLKRGVDYEIVGDPKDAYSASKLFQESPKQFEIWAVGLVQGVPQPDKVADRGADGKVYFQDLEGKLQWAVCQVKGGHLTPNLIRDFAHVVEREKAAMGFFICLETPTKGMYNEAQEAGFFTAPSGRKIPRLQIRTIHELLDEKKEFDFPVGYSLRSGPARRLTREGEQRTLGMGEAQPRQET